MSATDKTADFDVGAVAHVNFRVRGERLGHGEEVFLVAQDDPTMQRVSNCRRRLFSRTTQEFTVSGLLVFLLLLR
jgi:hypothetical protein